MPRYYVDLDNNRLLAGPSTTQLAATPRLYQGDKPTLDLELLARDNGVLGHYTSTASAINVRVGTQGGTGVASALSLSTVTLSITATATASIVSPVTATGVASLLGSVTATATAGINTPINGVISATVTSLSHAAGSAVIQAGELRDVQISSCGRYFHSPSVLFSEPDQLLRKDAVYEVSQSVPNVLENPTLISAASSGVVLNVIASTSTTLGLTTVTGTEFWCAYEYNQGGWLSQSLRNTEANPDFNGINARLRMLSCSSAGVNNFFSQARVSNLRLGGATSQDSAVLAVTFESRNTAAAQGSPVIEENKITQINISNAGDGYYTPPDVWIVPDRRDYTLASAITVTAATASGRTISATVASGHGLVAGDYIMASGLRHESNTWSATGVWTVTSSLATSIQYRIATMHVHPSNSVALTLESASLRKLLLRSYVSAVTVTSSGSGFSSAIQVVTISSQDCYGYPSIIHLGTSGGTLSSVSIVTTGLGFSSATVTAPVVAYGSLNSLTVVCAGAGYWFSLPAITVDSSSYVATAPGATPAVISAGLNGNGSLSLSIACAGYGYTSAPTVTIAPPNGGDGVRIVTLVTRGIGYSDGTFSCTVSAPPAGGAQAVVNFVKSGTSQGFVVVNPGRGYTSTPLVTVPTPDLGGQISSFTITSAGAAYSSGPQVSFSGGGGTGAAATAILTNGSVTSISLTAAGSGYTSAPAVSLAAPDTSVFYSKQIDLSSAGVTTLLAGNSSASAYLQVEEKRGADTTVLAQVPVTIIARVS